MTQEHMSEEQSPPAGAMGVDHATAGAARGPAEPRPHHDPAAAPRDGKRHHATVTAETRKLERSLRAIGPMPRTMLARVTQANSWREGSFEEAVKEGIREGRLEELPLGWLKVTRH